MTKVRRWMVLLATGALMSLGTTACGVSNIGTKAQHHAASTTIALSTRGTSPQAPVSTEIPTVNPPTTIINYPKPYEPSYDTIASLADDSTFIVIAIVGPGGPDGYPLYVQQAIGTNPVKVSIGITTTEFDAARLAVGGTYIFFDGIDPVDHAVCIVGGVRGVFAYDPAKQTVTRLAQSSASQIPNIQTLTQLENAISASERVVAAQPTANTPPVCASSATGLP